MENWRPVLCARQQVFTIRNFPVCVSPLPLKEDPFGAGAENRVSEWAEMFTRNSFGKGILTYEGTVLSDKLQERVLRTCLCEPD